MVLTVDVPSHLVQGDVDEGYGAVADAFRHNFTDRGEIGAACAFYRDGRKVVDLWGGYRDGIRKLEWQQDTLVTMFSATKGMSSLAIPVAHSRGLLDVDEPVATYWPEFARHGKAAITVRQLLSHQAGLAVLDRPLDLDTVRDFDRLATILAAQTPAWEPGTRHGYHAMTLGFYESELLRRESSLHLYPPRGPPGTSDVPGRTARSGRHFKKVSSRSHAKPASAVNGVSQRTRHGASGRTGRTRT
jgi:CubicO group peptidase (beta-lactamase class C family)